jgi:hypothetical protein
MLFLAKKCWTAIAAAQIATFRRNTQTRVHTMTCGKLHGAMYPVPALHACARRSTLTSRAVTRPCLGTSASFRELSERSSYIYMIRLIVVYGPV